MNLDIGNFKVGLNKVFIIAEIGNNHNGSIERAIEMIDQAKDIGVDAVKFQMRNLSKVYREKSLNKQNLFILFASYIFYAWWDWRVLALIFFSSIVDFLIGIQILKKSKTLKRAKYLWAKFL